MNTLIKAEISGVVWKVLVDRGQHVAKDEAVMILEAMKMEIPVQSPRQGRISELRVGQGDQVAEGQLVAILSD